MNCTASSYFIPPSINARATSTGALLKILINHFFQNQILENSTVLTLPNTEVLLFTILPT